MREALGVVGRDQAAVDHQVDVVGLVHRHDRGLQAVGDRARLLAGTAVRLLDRQCFAGGLFPFGDEGRVDVLEQFPHDVIGNIQQHRVGGARRDGQRQGQRRDGGGENPAAGLAGELRWRKFVGHNQLVL